MQPEMSRNFANVSFALKIAGTAQAYGVGAIIIAVNPSYRHCERSEAIRSTYECRIASLCSQ
jgi:hypothetical protein